MEQYYKLLQENNGFDFDNNSINKIKNIVSLKFKKYKLELEINNVLTLEEYKKFVEVSEEIFNNNGVLETTFLLTYTNTYIKSDVLKTYVDFVLEQLVNSSLSYKFLYDYKFVYEDNQIFIHLDTILDEMKSIVKNILELLKTYGVICEIELVLSDKIKTLEQIKMENNIKSEKERLELQEERIKTNAVNRALLAAEKKAKRNIITKICDIPNGKSQLLEYEEKNEDVQVTIQGVVFFVEIKEFKNASLLSIKLSDGTDSILVQKWLRGDKDKDDAKLIKENKLIRVSGKIEFSEYLKSILISNARVSIMGDIETKKRTDDALVKRVELHCHTKYSNLDSVSSATDYMQMASHFGHKAIGFCDHSGVYAIPEINKASKKYPDVLPLFGVELAYVDDTAISVTQGNSDCLLRESSYVVFDIETTGFSTSRDQIIEIAAVKIENGLITDTYESFVKPTIAIPAFITDLTTITEADVANAPSVDIVLKQFLEFSENCILVAHNASFDVSHIQANMSRCNIDPIDFLVIDTLNLSRAMYYKELKWFNLKVISKFFKVKQEQHHRAIDDTKVTAECFLFMLGDIYKRDITIFNDVNKVMNVDEIWKFVIPNHINILAKNQNGLKNMYKLLSDCLTNHFSYEARLLKSVLNEFRQDIFVSSGCVHSEVFETALNKEESELEKVIVNYDYVEVQPPVCYAHLFDTIVGGRKVIEDTIKLIIKVAKKHNIMVVATSDAHYVEEEQKRYRDILIGSPQIGGGQHSLARYKTSPSMHLRTTNEMLNEFEFLDSDLAYEIVVTNSNKIADSIEKIKCFPNKMFVPADDEFKDSLNVASMIEETKRIVAKNVLDKYGENPHPLVTTRVKRELDAIIESGYYSTYFMSYLLVNKSLEAGYLVGSRGSVGSSLVATMMQITEINPLPPHYNCPHCKFTAFKFSEEDKDYINSDEEEALQGILRDVESGYDLPDLSCPICGHKLIKDGHDIPFETFLGFNGDKVPDIDLNFSGEYQPIAHEYVRELMGYEHAYRGGTVSTVADKNAFGYVKSYLERKNIEVRSAEVDRLSSKIVGVKRSTGQHPGGIVVVPKAIDIYDITPVQYPADNISNTWITTHFDYHAFEDNLLKLDILGHDDPTMIRYFMEYVNSHQSDFPFSKPEDIPVDDKEVYKLFCTTEVIGLRNSDILSEVASYAVPEFGTNFVRQMLTDTLPKSFAELVKISGLSHGTGVWLTNAQELVLGNTDYGEIPFSDVIGCRDDIMVYLMYQGLEPLKAFQIMEFVRKGQVKSNPEKWQSFKEDMVKNNVPQWYIWSCEKIEYMFPKAHATAYVLMALRIAWFKVYSPVLFYSAYFSKRAKAYDVFAFISGKEAIKNRIKELSSIKVKTAKDEDLLTSLYVALEMVSRGISFLPVCIEKSQSSEFAIEDGNLRIPFVAVDGLGEAAALDIVEKRKEKAFTSISDVSSRTKINKTLLEVFKTMNSFGDLDLEDKEVEQGLFAFL